MVIAFASYPLVLILGNTRRLDEAFFRSTKQFPIDCLP